MRIGWRKIQNEREKKEIRQWREETIQKAAIIIILLSGFLFISIFIALLFGAWCCILF